MSLSLHVLTSQKPISTDDSVPCWACLCVRMYCTCADMCLCSAQNRCCCLKTKLKKKIKCLKCHQGDGTVVFDFFCMQFLVKKPSPIVSFTLESWTKDKRSLLAATGEIGCCTIKIDLPDGCGVWKPGCTKKDCCRNCCNMNYKCCCCVWQAGLPCRKELPASCSLFGLACLPTCGCCMTVPALQKKKKSKKANKAKKKKKRNQMTSTVQVTEM